MTANNDTQHPDLAGIRQIGLFKLRRRKDTQGSGELIHGVGVNDAPYMVTYNYASQKCPAYKLWTAMLLRADRENLSINPVWLSFMSFREWFIQQPWRDSVLDSMLSDPDEYDIGPEVSLMVPTKFHRLLTLTREWQLSPESRIKTNGLPVGVTFYKRDGLYQAKIRHLGATKQTHIGYFGTVDEAKEAYGDALAANLEKIQDSVRQENPRLAEVIEEFIYVI